MIAKVTRNNGAAAQRPAGRTKAQQEASRRNGRLSRGPVTAAGKARARANAVTHGLFARHVMPPDDPREHDKAYRQFHRELAREFKPSGFTERAAVAQLASLYVQLGRVTRLIEALQQLPVTRTERERWHARKRYERETSLLADALARCDGEVPFAYSQRDAQRLARAICETVEDTDRSLAEAEEEDALADDEMDQLELEELQAVRHLAAQIKPLRRRLTDRYEQVALFRGDRAPRRGELKRIGLLLETRIGHVRRYLAGQEDEAKDLRRLDRQLVRQLAQQPDGLMKLENYRSRIQGSIDRQLRILFRA